MSDNPAPFPFGDSSGNLKCKAAGTIIGMRWVARHTDVVTKVHLQLRNLLADGSSYFGGTGGSYVWQHRKVNADGTPDMTAGGLLSTETYLPNDARISNYCTYVNANFATVRGREYCTLLKNGDATPATNYASWNFLYNGSGVIGAQSRNERNAAAQDAYYGLDPRECVFVSQDGGSTWTIPGSSDADPTAKQVPVYIQEFADGTKLGQPYFSAAGSAGGSWVMTFRNITRGMFVRQIGSYISLNGGTTSVTVKIGTTLVDTVSISGAGRHAVNLTTPIWVPAASTLVLGFTIDPTGAAGADIRPIYTRSSEWTTLMGITGTYDWSSSGTANPAYYSPPVYPLPYMQPARIAGGNVPLLGSFPVTNEVGSTVS